jgi:hypothetical protein
MGRDMSSLIGPILVLGGFGFYMATNVWLGRFRWMPYEFLAVSATGVAITVAQAVTAPSGAATIAASVATVLFGVLCWFFFSFSMYAAREDRPRVGEPFAEFRLPASDGSLYDSASKHGRRRLCIFYRGSW